VTEEPFDFLVHAKASARDALNGLDGPAEDIIPVLLTHGKRGLGITALTMPDDAAKEKVAQLMIASIAFAEATECVFICTAWMGPPNEMDVPPSQHPDRMERVILVHQQSTDKCNLYAAPVIRHDNRPPDLGQWEEMGGAMGGRFGDAIEYGMKLAKSVPVIPGLAESINESWEGGTVASDMELFVKVLNQGGFA
jgi:hypothetical protein